MATRPDDADALTRLGVAVTVTGGGDLSSSAPTVPTSFVPGAIIAGRYRLVALLGRGGMGEVYRADDLTLDQAVALKFLPVGAATASTLTQFHNELRIARQVSHRNVCRLYDVGEADGRRFITMEYVDGEDLASLIRRIGRLSSDKAVEIARQLCAGLAAAHDRGVIHRDLKPANVMLDGEGNVRITDFGLAIPAGDANASLAGTPHYMAPEQLSGRAASVQSDIYALGLVLFELFTGKRANSGTSLEDIKRWHDTASHSSLSAFVRDIDPAVESLVRRCLERDPGARPTSALAVAAALPGANPLAEALAAGHTPSPELVASVGGTVAMNAWLAVALGVCVVLGVLGAAVYADRMLMIARVPFAKPLDVLEDRAKQLIARVGYTQAPIGEMRTLMLTYEYASYVVRTSDAPNRWDPLKTGAFPSIRFLYRGSPRPLEPGGTAWQPGPEDPPLNVTDMTSVILDSRGMLMQFIAIPPQYDASAGAPHPLTNWQPLFEAAGLPMDTFQPSTPQWAPYSYSDERAAWEGPLPEAPDVRVHVDVGAYRGRPTFFRRTGPWTVPTRQVVSKPPLSTIVFYTISSVAFFLLFVGAALLARFNLRKDRADRQSANRVAAVMFALAFAGWALGAQHSLNPQAAFNQFLQRAIAPALMNAALVWLLYLALEPYVRRYTPETLVSWVRLISGRFNDPRVGRDVLIGLAFGVAGYAFRGFVFALPSLLGNAPPPPQGTNLEMIMSAGRAAAVILQRMLSAFLDTMLLTIVFMGCRALTRRTWAAVILTLAFFTVVIAREFDFDLLPNLLFSLITSSFGVIALWRFGVLTCTTAAFTSAILTQAPLTLDTSRIYASTSMWLIALFVALTVATVYAAKGRQPLFAGLSGE